AQGAKQNNGGCVIVATDAGIAVDRSAKRFLADKSFDVLIMDETSRETLTGALVPCQYLEDTGKMIMVGDTKQLEPFRDFDDEAKFKKSGVSPEYVELFYESILAQSEGQNISDEVMLSTNWRSHPLISGLISEVFYGGDINRRGWEDFSAETLQLKVSDIGDDDEATYEEPIGTSFQNTRSALEVMQLLDEFIQQRKMDPKEITIVVFFKAQEELLNSLIRAKYAKENCVKVTTIDSFQGGENKTIIVDFVRSNLEGEMGFISNVNRLNVTLSRAVENMAIVWDSRIFLNEPDVVMEEEKEIREVLKKIYKYYMDEVWQFFPDEGVQGKAKKNGKIKVKKRETQKKAAIQPQYQMLKQQVEEETFQLANGLFNLALNCEEDEKILFALDENLGREGTINLVLGIIRELKEFYEAGKGSQDIFNKIIIERGKGETLAKTVLEYTGEKGKNKIKIKKSNVIMVTKTENQKNCLGFAGEAIVTFVDDSELEIDSYYPFIEITLFTLVKALHCKGIRKYDTAKLLEIYKTINAEMDDDKVIIQRCIEKRSVVIKLVPADPIEYEALKDIYDSIRRVLKAS
ncbi:MAG: AAA domain-containing protein, partial [Candidatus Omnitrophota bacterium]